MYPIAGTSVSYFSLPIDPNENKLLLCWLQKPLLCVRAPLGSNCVVSLSKAHLLPKSTGNTQEAGLRPNMTEKWFTGTLRINQPTFIVSLIILWCLTDSHQKKLQLIFILQFFSACYFSADTFFFY